MNKTIKIIISSVIVIATLVAIYLGSFAPFKKSQLYLSTLKMTRAGGEMSADSLLNGFDRSLQFYSPAGERELIKFYTSFTNGLIKKENISPEAAILFVEHIEENITDNYLFHYLNLAELYDSLYRATENEEYLLKAEKYLLLAHEIAPKLPQPLEGLMINYIFQDDTEKLEEIAEKILTLWPDHPVIQENI